MSRRQRSTALTVTAGGRQDHPTQEARQDHSEAEKLPVPQDLVVPAALLLSAEAVSEHKDDKRPYLQGVYLHAQDGLGRVVGTDGSRMFVASFPIEGEAPEWLADGLILSNDGLKARIGMIAKGSEGADVRVTYAAGQVKAAISDPMQSMVFQVAQVTGVYPDYNRVIGSDSFVRHDDEGQVKGSEWEPVGINSAYLKHIGEVAKLLDAGLPKEARSKKGMIVRAFNSSGAQKTVPLVFDFSTWPGAILVIMPARLSSPSISAQTAVLLAPAIKMTIAALRAHETRNRGWAEEADSEEAKAAFIAKADGFQARVAEILKRAPGLTAISAQPDPESEADNAEQDATDGDPEGEETDPQDEADDRQGDLMGHTDETDDEQDQDDLVMA